MPSEGRFNTLSEQDQMNSDLSEGGSLVYGRGGSPVGILSCFWGMQEPCGKAHRWQACERILISDDIISLSRQVKGHTLLRKYQHAKESFCSISKWAQEH